MMRDKEAPAGNSTLSRFAAAPSDAPLSAALSVIGGKWKVNIVSTLAEEPAHFAALQRKIRLISRKVLAEQLRELQAHAIVDRRAGQQVYEPVVYSLTAYGRSLLPVIAALYSWGLSHLERGVEENSG